MCRFVAICVGVNNKSGNSLPIGVLQELGLPQRPAAYGEPRYSRVPNGREGASPAKAFEARV